MSAYLAAESIGLKGLMIGAVRNDTLKTAEILGLPKRVYCVFGMCLGWPGRVPRLLTGPEESLEGPIQSRMACSSPSATTPH